MSDYNWSGLLKHGRTSSAGLYQALLAAQRANDPAAAYSSLNDVALNPSRIPGDTINGITMDRPNPNYIRPKDYRYSAPSNPGAGGVDPVDGGGDTPTGNPWDAPGLSDAQRFNLYQDVDIEHSLLPDFTGTHDLATQAGNPLLEALKAAKARGQITDTGFTGGMTKYNKGLTDSESYLNTLIPGQLNQARLNLTGINDAAIASVKKDPTNFHFNDYMDSLKSSANSFTQGLPSSLSANLGSQGFFDIPSAMTEAGRAQGAFNPASSDSLLQALIGQTKKGSQGTLRGLGNQGAF